MTGFEARVDGKIYSLREQIPLKRYSQHTIEILIDRVPLGWPIERNPGLRSRLAEAVETALERGNDTVLAVLDDGSEMLMSSRFSCPDDGFTFPEIEPRLFSFNSPYGACSTCHGLGTVDIFSDDPCETCHGKRLRDESLHVLIGKKSIVDVTSQNVRESLAFFEQIPLSETEATIAAPILREIKARLTFLSTGLHYLRSTARPDRSAARRSVSACVPDRLAPRRRALRPRRTDDRLISATTRGSSRRSKTPRPRKYTYCR